MNVFQTAFLLEGEPGTGKFQSLTWVERLSDVDNAADAKLLLQFQSLTWVERLSDRTGGGVAERAACFNPSPGLNVFQTGQLDAARNWQRLFQSLTWVERLSDVVDSQ